MWFRLHPPDLDYALRAPFRIEVDAHASASPLTLFRILTDPDAMKHWFADFVSSRWMTAPPHGPGSAREMQCKAIAIRDRILAWDPARRVTSAVQAMTAPLAREMLQEVSLEPTQDGNTRMRWCLYYAPSRSLRLLHPLARTMFTDMLTQSSEGLVRYVARQRLRDAHA